MGNVLYELFSKKGQEKLIKKVPDNFFDFNMKDINGDVVDFATFKDRKLIMCVNVASK